MLLELSIRNFAIIEDLSIELDPGLTILSGETGAGKSIIINAVNLILGGRASAGLIRTGADSAELEALFEVPLDSPLAAAMTAMGHEPSEGLMVRRIISRSDRHRVYINGRLATMQVLGDLTAHLASISGQHAHQGLLKEDQHLAIVDQFGALRDLRNRYSRAHNAMLPLIDKHRDLLTRRDSQEEQLTLLQFQRREIEQAALTIDEDQMLEKEQRRLKNSENLLNIVQGCLEQLYNQSGAVVESLFEMSKEMARAGELDEQLATAASSLETLAYGAEDLANHLTTYLKHIDLDPQQLETVEARLDLINKLKRKYGGSLGAVMAHGREVDRQLEDIENIDAVLADLEKDLQVRHSELCRLAGALSRTRHQTAGQIATAVESQLADLKMTGTRFRVGIHDRPAGKETSPYLVDQHRLLSPTGTDSAAFMIAPNLGEGAKPLAAIASGGELSRVILALKAIEAESDSLETLVFDEVDAGIGGATADLVGKKLSLLARHHQVICITHLPQIACYGDHHFCIAKHIRNQRTHTIITSLDVDQRITEIARMIGGEQITPTTLANAREMLNRAKDSSKRAAAKPKVA